MRPTSERRHTLAPAPLLVLIPQDSSGTQQSPSFLLQALLVMLCYPGFTGVCQDLGRLLEVPASRREIQKTLEEGLVLAQSLGLLQATGRPRLIPLL